MLKRRQMQGETIEKGVGHLREGGGGGGGGGDMRDLGGELLGKCHDENMIFFM